MQELEQIHLFLPKMKKSIFVISGLGADHEVFKKLELSGYEMIHIKWVDTIKGESLAEYATRLLPQITEQNPIIMGLSLGGMLALEVSKQIPTEKVISLSSAIGYHELPWYYMLAGRLKAQKWLPIYAFARGNYFTNWLFGVQQKDDIAILQSVFDRLDKNFLFWALNAVLKWDKNEKPKNMIRIHGTSDRVLPMKKKVKYDAVIKNGTHLMLLDKSEEVSAILNKYLS